MGSQFHRAPRRSHRGRHRRTGQGGGALGVGAGPGTIGAGIGIGFIFGKEIEVGCPPARGMKEIQSIRWPASFCLTEAMPPSTPSSSA